MLVRTHHARVGVRCHRRHAGLKIRGDIRSSMDFVSAALVAAAAFTATLTATAINAMTCATAATATSLAADSVRAMSVRIGGERRCRRRGRRLMYAVRGMLAVSSRAAVVWR